MTPPHRGSISVSDDKPEEPCVPFDALARDPVAFVCDVCTTSKILQVSLGYVITLRLQLKWAPNLRVFGFFVAHICAFSLLVQCLLYSTREIS